MDTLPQEAQQQHPWTLYWLAMSRVSISPRESRLIYERAAALKIEPSAETRALYEKLRAA